VVSAVAAAVAVAVHTTVAAPVASPVSLAAARYSVSVGRRSQVGEQEVASSGEVRCWVCRDLRRVALGLVLVGARSGHWSGGGVSCDGGGAGDPSSMRELWHACRLY
jgi:hypothetical protein